MDQLQNHNHKYYRGSVSGAGGYDKDLVGDPDTSNVPPAQSNLVARGRIGDETRVKNISIKIWQRIA